MSLSVPRGVSYLIAAWPMGLLDARSATLDHRGVVDSVGSESPLGQYRTAARSRRKMSDRMHHPCEVQQCIATPSAAELT